MEQAEIKALLDKYWRAETTLEEERRLADYFRQSEPGPDPEPIRMLFNWREEEAQLRPGEDFDSRVLQRISAAGHGGAGERTPVFSIRFAAAAAVILCISISFLVVVTAPSRVAPPVVAIVRQPRADATIKDTYTDPQQALAAVRRALVMASVRINEGEQITQKNITRLHNSWQAATGND